MQVFLDITKCPFRQVAPSALYVPVSPAAPTERVSCCLIFANLIGDKCYLSVVCISLIISEFEQFFLILGNIFMVFFLLYVQSFSPIFPQGFRSFVSQFLRDIYQLVKLVLFFCDKCCIYFLLFLVFDFVYGVQVYRNIYYSNSSIFSFIVSVF